MKLWSLNRCALISCVAFALLAGCAGSQLPIGAPGIGTAAATADGVARRAPGTSSYRVLHEFGRYPRPRHDHGGANPDGSLLEVNGTFYGTTQEGGHGAGVVYTIDQSGAKKVLYRFGGTSNGDGANPSGDLTEVNGELYGTTDSGGKCQFGTVYSITTTGAEKVLHSFCGSAGDPTGGVVDVNGMLYGSTTGSPRGGSIYSISTTGAFKVLHAFSARNNRRGGGPIGRLLDVNGTLYGVTAYGGSHCPNNDGCGTVFSVTTSGEEKVLYSFKGWDGATDGWLPGAGLIAVNGTLYGTTLAGGQPGCSSGCGVIYSVTTGGQETVLYRFTGGSDGGNPNASLLDVNGALYGTTTSGGGSAGYGTIFSMSTSGGVQVLHSFGGADGATPQADLIENNGTLYGTTFSGGVEAGCTHFENVSGCGTVFALTL